MTEQPKTLAKGTLGARQLANDLRNTPEEFIWDFGEVLFNSEEDSEIFEEIYGKKCGTAGCALGLAEYLYGQSEFSERSIHDIFGMEQETYREIFFSPEFYGTAYMEDVTPEMVADALEKWADEEEGKAK